MFKAVFAPTVVAVALFAGAVNAADLAPQAVEPVAPAYTPFDWSGPYIGLHAGYGWGRESDNHSSENGPILPTNIAADHFDMNGFVGGAHAGYNYQINQFVVGAEADIDYADVKGSHRYNYAGGSWTGRLQMKSEWQGSVRLRAGYAFDNILLYATGGVAFAQGKLSDRGQLFGNAYGTSDTNTHVGWTIGAGAEYAFTQNWIGRVEVRYTDFQKKRYVVTDPSVKAGWTQTTATVGVSYKF
ncbi:porin family protein [Labrys sp. LIt4]|uniref:outer membrane protein n=1 Tax=Labrys sp. LIt4 TaxID=2821355 RepID=UPI001AE03769|nr:outer membrane protein [Labrys sp. LIt4]MBP0581852.1 porin family protein [Labrys sp. LIt4]